MIKRIPERDAIGKTIKEIHIDSFDRYGSIIFDDNTALVIEVEHGYDGDGPGLSSADSYELEPYEMKYLFLIDETEYKELVEKEKIKQQEQKDKFDRERYEELKKKFESSIQKLHGDKQ